ncbi:MAG: BTAD domain-containing putative transcriptional regulator [Thermodesulfobacteriota bacterium]|nr:BTAD domain-containing putative transcriptional regulator [Thermodesulfobacteriota bacterium]
MKPSAHIPKVVPPRLPHILERPRLTKLLKQNNHKKLLLILGQGAQGKTTLAASYVKNATTPSAWLNLDRGESDPVNLFHLLVQALQYISQETDLSSILDYPSMAMGPRAEMPLYRDWVQALFERIPKPMQIVLDGLDRLSPEAPSFGLLQVMLEDAPEDVCLLMLSREMPPLEIHYLEIKQEAFLLTNKDLAFTLAEVKKFFRDVRNMTLPSDQWSKVHETTEGWIGGLILLSEAISRKIREPKGEYTFDDNADGFSKQVFRYFGDEVLAAQSKPVREFLVKSSIADAIEPEFMNELLGAPEGDEILRDLERRNLFTQSVYDKTKGWLYRYHQMFREFLNSKLEAETRDEERRSLLFKAGTLSEQRGELEDSIKYYLRAKAFPEAVAIIERMGMDVLRKGRIGDLAQWLESLPEEVQENPWLLLFLSMTRRFTEVKENVTRLKKALTLFEEHGDVRGQLLALAYLIEAVITRGRDPIPLAVLLEQGDTLLGSLTSDQHPYERAVLWFSLGFGHMIRGGNPRKGAWACQNAYLLSKNLGDLPLQINALVHSVNNLSSLGEFPQADKFCETLEKLVDKHTYPELRTLYRIAASQLFILEGFSEKAKAMVDMARADIERHGLLYLYPVMLLYDLISKAQLEEFAEAEEAGNRLMSFSLSMDNLFLYGDAALFLGLSYYHKEDFQEARAMLEKSREILSSDEARADWQFSLAHILTSLVSYHLGESKSTEKKLHEVLDYHNDMSSHFFMVESRFAMALLKWKEDRATEVARHLQAGFKIAKERGYEHFMLLSSKDLVRVCTLAIELEVSEAVGYAVHLLSTRLASKAGSELERLSDHPNAKIRKRVRETRKAIHLKNVPHLHIQTLGGFRVFRDEALLEDREWQGSQPKLLLKAIIARGSGKVSKELLMEDLWPDALPSKGETNFRVTLHRLRKALEPEINKTFGSSYILLEDGFLSLHESLCQVDAEAFLSLCEEGKREEKRGHVRNALSLYHEAAQLYQGDFLAEDLYALWAQEKRRELRSKYVALLNKMAGLYEARGASRKAIASYKALIQTDPLLEGAYQKLMTLYSNLGKRSAALGVYDECRKALKAGLDTEPDKVTTSLYNKILETT